MTLVIPGDSLSLFDRRRWAIHGDESQYGVDGNPPIVEDIASQEHFPGQLSCSKNDRLAADSFGWTTAFLRVGPNEELN
jgi:hypothetical protein